MLRAPAFAYSLAAAALLLALALGAWGLSRGEASGGVRLASHREHAYRLDVTYLPGKSLAVLAFDLPPLGRGQSYQAWQLTGGRAVSLGVLDRNSGQVAFSVNLDGAEAVAISIEPAGGSQTPTRVAITSPFS